MGLIIPVRIFIVVVFPAPLGPNKPNIFPFCILKDKLLLVFIFQVFLGIAIISNYAKIHYLILYSIRNY